MNRIEELMKLGWTTRFAKHYIDDFSAEDAETCYDPQYRKWAHVHGYKVESACAYDLDEHNIKDYLSDYDYYRLFPVNDWTRIWVNDKLTLKYMLSNTLYDDIMPRYYYYSSFHGLRALMDNPGKSDSIEDFISLLEEKKEFACKPNNGAMAKGFVKMSFDKGEYRINDSVVSKQEIIDFVTNNLNYIYTEYIYPSQHFKRYGNKIHTLRVVILNERGNNPVIIGGYLRLPNPTTKGDVNYNILSGDDTNAYVLLAGVNYETGEYGNAKKVFINRYERCAKSPIGNFEIQGEIANYGYLKDTLLNIARRFGTLEWLGFDIGITDDGFKCMEINTLPGIKYMQMYRPLYADAYTREYFQRKLREIDNLTEDEILVRNKIAR